MNFGIWLPVVLAIAGALGLLVAHFWLGPQWGQLGNVLGGALGVVLLLIFLGLVRYGPIFYSRLRPRAVVTFGSFAASHRFRRNEKPGLSFKFIRRKIRGRDILRAVVRRVSKGRVVIWEAGGLGKTAQGELVRDGDWFCHRPRHKRRRTMMQRSVLLITVLLVALALVSACTGNQVPGKYISEQNPRDYLELKRDGTFYLQEEGVTLTGKYQVDGDEITLSVSILGIPTATKGSIKGNVIVDDDGERWVRKGGATPASTAKSSGSPSTTLKQTPTPKSIAKYRVAFEARASDGKTNIYVMKEDGTNLNKIAEGGKRPVWSPDGQRIAFVSTASGDQGALYVAKPDGTSLAKLTRPGVLSWRPVDEFLWSPDGQFLFYTDDRKGMHVISADGVTDTGKDLPGSYEVSAASYTWSTTGPKVAIRWWSLGGYALLIHDFNSGGSVVVVEVLPDKMIWSADGAKLLYALKDGHYVVNAEGLLPTKIIPASKSERFVNESAVLGVTWAPSGKKLAYWTREGKAYTINEDGSDDRQVAEGLLLFSNKALVIWSPDSRKLAFIGTDDKVHVISVDGSTNQTVGNGVTRGTGTLIGGGLRTDPAIVWSSDSTKLFVRTGPTYYYPEPQAETYVVGADGQGLASVATLLTSASGGLSLVGNLMWEPVLKAVAVDRFEVRVKRMQAGSGCSATDPGPVQSLDLEKEYLPVVVASENGAAAVPLEALKAQAVASRTFALYKMQYEPRSPSFDVCNTQADQVYNPLVTVSPQARKAVEETRGIVGKWNGEIIAAFFVKGDAASGTAQFVTVNEGKKGKEVRSTTLGSSANTHNRGAMSQDKVNELAAQGWDYQRILRYFYGADLEFSNEPK